MLALQVCRKCQRNDGKPVESDDVTSLRPQTRDVIGPAGPSPARGGHALLADHRCASGAISVVCDLLVVSRRDMRALSGATMHTNNTTSTARSHAGRA